MEITNKSLLAINAALEANKHKQAKEIRELRRRLRETRLSLPPRVFKELKASTNFNDNDDADDEDDGDSVAPETDNTDAIYNRVRDLIDGLLESGKKALESTPADFLPGKSATRVLHEVEARPWRDGRMSLATESTNDDSFFTANSDDEETNPPSAPRLHAFDKSEDEVENLVTTST